MCKATGSRTPQRETFINLCSLLTWSDLDGCEVVQNRWKGRPYQFVSAWFILLPYLWLPYITMRVRAGEIFPNQQLIRLILIWLLEEDWLDLNPPVVELQIITFHHPGMVSIRNLSPEYRVFKLPPPPACKGYWSFYTATRKGYWPPEKTQPSKLL